MDAIIERLADEAMADLADKGGGTYEGRTLLAFEPENGYAVGIGGIAMNAECVTVETLAFCLKAVAGEYMTTYAGTWLDDGVVYIDAVLYFGADQFTTALNCARAYGQKAFYGFAEKESFDAS